MVDTLTIEQILGVSAVSGALGAAIITLGIFALIIGIAVYAYWASAYYTIATKLGRDNPWMAWVPLVNIFYLPQIAGQTWAWGFLIVFPPAYMIGSIVWNWQIYAMRKYESYLALIPVVAIIPFLAPFVWIANFVVIGMVAWKDKPTSAQKVTKSSAVNFKKAKK